MAVCLSVHLSVCVSVCRERAVMPAGTKPAAREAVGFKHEYAFRGHIGLKLKPRLALLLPPLLTSRFSGVVRFAPWSLKVSQETQVGKQWQPWQLEAVSL